jgi:hypothetical protein
MTNIRHHQKLTQDMKDRFSRRPLYQLRSLLSYYGQFGNFEICKFIAELIVIKEKNYACSKSSC